MECDIERTLLALEVELGIRITVHDLGGVFHDHAGNPLLDAARHSHKRNPLCFTRERKDCLSYCMGKVNALVGRCEEGYLRSVCWAGIVEIVAPVHCGQMHVATIFAGAWREAGREVPSCFKKSKSLAEAYRQLPVITSGQASRLGAILANTGRGMLSQLEYLQRMDSEPGSRKEEISRYVSMNAGRKITIRDMARQLHVSSSRAGHIVNEIFGVSFAKLLIQERIKRAKNLLRSTDYRVGEIALKVGFPNEFHFSRMFKRYVGTAPGRFRRSGAPPWALR